MSMSESARKVCGKRSDTSPRDVPRLLEFALACNGVLPVRSGRESEQYQSDYSPRYSLYTLRHFSQFSTANHVLINPKERKAAPLMMVAVWPRSDLEIPSLSNAVPITRKVRAKKGASMCFIDVCIRRF
jgi:hypothetical protein